MTRHYCCYFDHRYLPRGLTMIRSLRRFEPDSPIWVLCLSDACYQLLLRLGEPGVRPLQLSEVENGDAELAVAKSSRSVVEYYFTLTPTWIRFVLARIAAEDSVTYVDGDLYFFSDPAPLHAELGDGAVSIIAHRFLDDMRRLESLGVYNVGWLTFRNDSRARTVVEWWRARCNEWCYDIVEENRFGDQKYLDQFPRLFEGVVELRHPGANVAPWNLGRYRVARTDGVLTVNAEDPLVFFHFHGLKRLNAMIYTVPHWFYKAPFAGIVRREIYRPYMCSLMRTAAEVEGLGNVSDVALTRESSGRLSPLRRLKGRLLRTVESLRAIVYGQIILVMPGRIV